MDNTKLLTIIVPVYNVSKYINQCLDSLVENKSILDDLEVIVVNDGSTDDSGEKAQVYADKYPQTIILVNKENGGHGSALNIGIEMASGKYLKCLDSDDWVKSDGLERLIHFIKNQPLGEEVDLIINPSEDYWDSTGKKHLRDFGYLKGSDTFNLKLLADNKYTVIFWNTTIKTQIYRNNDIPAIDEGIFYDDIEFSLYTLPYIHTACYLPDVIYQYRRGTPGQSMNPANKLKRQWMYEQVLEKVYNYRLVGGSAQRLIEIRAAKMVGEDCALYMLWEDRKKAKDNFRIILNKYQDLPISQCSNRKLKLLYKTNLFGFGILSFYFRMKTGYLWKDIKV